jgi:hypothetical protein
MEGEGSGPDASAAESAARRDALGQTLQLFLSTGTAAPDSEVLSELSAYLGPGDELSSSRHAGRTTRRERFAVRYRALAADLERRGLIHPGAIVGRPRLILALDPSPWSKKASEILIERLGEAGFEAVASAAEHPLADARRQGARVLVQGGAQADQTDSGPLGRLVSGSASYDVTASWIPAESTAAAVVLPGRISETAKAYELTAADAQARAADNAAISVTGRLRSWLADRLEERFRMTVLVLSLGERERVLKFLSAVRAVPGVEAAAMDVVAGGDVRFHVWTRRTSADELALQLKNMSGFHLVVRNVEPPYGWIELDTEDDY